MRMEIATRCFGEDRRKLLTTLIIICVSHLCLTCLLEIRKKTFARMRVITIDA